MKGVAPFLYPKGGMMDNYKHSDPIYHTETWKLVRAQALARDGGLCRDCMDRVKSGRGGKVRRATMVHHVIPVKERPDLAYNLENLRSLCNICHNQNHPEKGRGKPPQPKTVKMRVIKV